MIDFITLQTNDGDGIAWPHRRTVSISYSDKTPDVANLLGNLEHQTEFTRADLVTFARAVLTAFGDGQTDAETETDLFERVARNSKRSRAIAKD